MHRLSGGAKPPEQPSVELGERVPHVHHDNEAPQGCAHLKICDEQFIPGCAYRLGHLGVAAAGTERPDHARGKATANRFCAACRGAEDNIQPPANPKLAGQIPEYLQKQLANFKPAAGKKADRENPIMGGMVSTLSVEDMRDVAAYYAAQQLKPGALKDKDTLELGRKIWRGGDVSKGLPACAACHGANGAGLSSQDPRLAGQYAEYTQAQLKAFRSGERRNDANSMMQATVAE